jgi:uncharacterized integral membrane protein
MDDNEIFDVEDRLEPEPRRARDREPIPWGVILLLLWAVALIVFSVQNAENTTVEFLVWEWRMPVALLVMVTSLVTIVLTALGTAFYRRRRRKLRAVSEEQTSGH